MSALHLAQRADVEASTAEALATMKQGRPELKTSSDVFKPSSIDSAAALVGVSPTAVDRARRRACWAPPGSVSRRAFPPNGASARRRARVRLGLSTWHRRAGKIGAR